ncbi:hypothetical protein HK102_005331, partial [Quaeritorhiza haematococci]
MVSRENVPVARKGKGAITNVLWKVPMMWAGNILPNYKEVFGAASRRIVCFSFDKPIVNQDGGLVSRIIENELGNLLVKCTWLYRQLADAHGNKKFISFTPEYFSIAAQEVTAEMNLMANWFLHGKELSTGMGGAVYTEHADDPAHFELCSDITNAFRACCEFKGMCTRQDDVKGWVSSACQMMGYVDTKEYVAAQGLTGMAGSNESLLGVTAAARSGATGASGQDATSKGALSAAATDESSDGAVVL